MAYQSLNIIGSFSAATPFLQTQVSNDRERAEAYRQLLREQVTHRNPTDQTSEGPAEVAATSDRMTVGDEPEEGRSPYLFQRSEEQAEPKPAGEPDTSTNETLGDSDEHQLDVVV